MILFYFAPLCIQQVGGGGAGRRGGALTHTNAPWDGPISSVLRVSMHNGQQLDAEKLEQSQTLYREQSSAADGPRRRHPAAAGGRPAGGYF